MDKLLGGLIAVVLGVAFSFLMSFPVYLLWNRVLVGAVSGVHEISWIQAWGITLLISLLFKSSVHTQNS